MNCKFLNIGLGCLFLAFNASAGAPTILSEPQSLTVNNASAAAFTVVASNAVAYQWQFQGTNILAGGTNATLSLDDVNGDQAGNYTVVVTSPDNTSITSAPPAILTIVPGTIIQWTISTYPDGSSNTFLVQLFDHDKPATVENFIHYITSGSYSNMFFDRDVTNFVLQGGDYVTYDRTTNGLNGGPVSIGTNVFPSQLNSEFGVGPLIHNTFGTLAMALTSAGSNSASSAFFFNLADNSTNLDNQSGGFTVFGRILSGTNVLQYFNTLSAPSNGIFDYNSSIQTLPVNYDGLDQPTDANLFYCDFTFTPPPADTNPPAISITFPPPNETLTNGSDLTVQGTAQDDVGLAQIFCVLTPLTGDDAGESETNAALGTTLWSLDLGANEPGIYQLSAYAQDGAGNLSAPATEYFTNLAVLTLITNVDGQLTTNEEYLVPGQSYSVIAASLAGETFVNWQNNGTVSMDPEQDFVAETNFTLTVAFASTNLIVSQPPNITVNTGSSADFSVIASNVISYQWELVGSGPIAGATNATFAVNDVTASQSGSLYDVVVTSPDGEIVTSAPAMLTAVQGTTVELTISGLPDGSSSNISIELFDHDKPATVQNFIHYITSGAYSNTFFDYDATNYALLGGDYVTYDRLSNDLNAGYISTGTNRFPSQVDSEFNIGPMIPNSFGTLVMTSSGQPNLATGGFFFNLTNNSPYLDSFGYTVFGRIISGTNVLQYFNTLSAPSNGILDYGSFSDLPVNYDGTNAPTDANLFYCDFSFSTPPPVDTVPPTVSITSPVPGAIFTNANTLTVQGTAQDNLGLAEVFCVLTSIVGGYGNGSVTNAATGITNWSLYLGNFPPGIYQLTAFSQDGSGNLSAPATQYLTNLALLTINTNADGEVTTSPPQYLMPGQQYTVVAAPGPGQQFSGWTVNGVPSLNPVQTFTAIANVTLTVLYTPINPSTGLTITSPVSGSQALSIQSVLTISGTIASTNITQVTCQFFVNSNSVSSPQAANIVGTNWSLSVYSLGNGNYTVSALGASTTGGYSFAMANFSLLNVEQLTLNVAGGGSLQGNPGTYVVPDTYTVKAIPNPGQIFYSWSDGVTTTLNPSRTFNLTSDLTLTATFVPDDATLKGITFTYPPANASLTNASFEVAGKLPASLTFTQMTCQLFLQSNGITSAPQPVTLDPAAAKWAFPVSNLTAGSYKILAVAYDTAGKARLISENFNLLARLSVTAQPPSAGSVTAGLNGRFLEVGRSYYISAIPKRGQIFTYWTGPASSPSTAATTFVMSPNTVLTANFISNAFPSVAGTYTGLFINPINVSPTNSGFISVTTTGTGLLSGQLSFPSRAYPLEWKFPYTGFIDLSGAGLDGTVLEVALDLDLTNGTDAITGYVAGRLRTGQYLWISDLVLYRGVTRLSGSNAPNAGRYALLLQSETNAASPVAAGYATVSLAGAGAVALGGFLPDNTAIARAARISKDGIWPMYMSRYGGKGMIIGWETNTPAGTCNGQLFWFNPSIGYVTNLVSTGAAFSAPVADTQYQIILAGGTTNALTVGATRQFAPESPIVRISLLPSGLLSGVVDFKDNKLSFKGAFVSPSTGGAGFILGSGGQTYGFEISPQP